MAGVRIAYLCLVFSAITAACTSTAVTTTPSLVPSSTPPVTPIEPRPTVTVLPPNLQASPIVMEPTRASQIGYISFPYRAADAGNFALQPGETITLVWEEAPPGASRYEFAFLPDASGLSTLIGADDDASDGASVQWLVPPDLNGSFHAAAYYPDGHTVVAGPSGAIYSGTLPPADVCSLSPGGAGPIDLLSEPSSEAAVFAFLLPGSYAAVLQRTTDGWYLVDASQAYDSITTLPATGSGWISDQALIEFHGPCDWVPFIGG